MPVYGIGEGKNKENILPVVHDEFDPLIAEKQDQHEKQIIALMAANWSNGTQTVNVTGVSATDTVLVSPIPADIALYAAYGIICTAQGEGTLTFTCNFTPSNDISVNIVILGV